MVVCFKTGEIKVAISKWSPKTRYLHKYADSPCRASSLPFGHQFLMNKSTSLDFGVRSKHTFHMPVKSNYRNSKHSDGKGLFDVFGVILFLFILLINGIIRLITRKTRKFQKLTIDEILTEYTPYQFEEYIAGLFRALGCSAKTTSKSNDGGFDVVYRNSQNQKGIIEVKQYAVQHKVGRPLIQKLHSAKIDARADIAIFLTTSSFTAEAQKYAKRHQIRLIDGSALSRLIHKAYHENEKE